MMKKHLRLLFLLTIASLLIGCGKSSNVSDITITIGFPEYTTGYLRNLDDEHLEQLEIGGGELHITRSDCNKMPYVAIIHLVNPDDSLDWLEMPVVIEPGKIEVEIGDYITTSGTSLNSYLQQFLNGLQATVSSARKREMEAEEFRPVFSTFYRQQILLNRDNVVGDFIYRNYGIHLNEEDLQSVKTALGK